MMKDGILLTCFSRVKLPKTFLAVNLSDAFSFQEHHNISDSEGLEMKGLDRAAATTTSTGEAGTGAEASTSTAETTTEEGAEATATVAAEGGADASGPGGSDETEQSEEQAKEE